MYAVNTFYLNLIIIYSEDPSRANLTALFINKERALVRHHFKQICGKEFARQERVRLEKPGNNGAEESSALLEQPLSATIKEEIAEVKRRDYESRKCFSCNQPDHVAS